LVLVISKMIGGIGSLESSKDKQIKDPIIKKEKEIQIYLRPILASKNE
jgi:hypothetical protein